MLGHPFVQWEYTKGAFSHPVSLLSQGQVCMAQGKVPASLCTQFTALVESCPLLHGLELISSALKHKILRFLEFIPIYLDIYIDV